MEDWAEIRRLHRAEGMPIKAIVRHLGVARNTGVDPADRLVHEAGQAAQMDLWFPEPRIPVGFGQAAMLPVLVMTLTFSRFLTAVMLPSRQAGDLLAGMWQLISQVGAVSKTLVWDREAAIGGKAS